MPFVKNVQALNRRNRFLKQVSDSNSVNAASIAITVLVGVETVVSIIGKWIPTFAADFLNKQTIARVSINVTKEDATFVRIQNKVLGPILPELYYGTPPPKKKKK